MPKRVTPSYGFPFILYYSQFSLFIEFIFYSLLSFFTPPLVLLFQLYVLEFYFLLRLFGCFFTCSSYVFTTFLYSNYFLSFFSLYQVFFLFFYFDFRNYYSSALPPHSCLHNCLLHKTNSKNLLPGREYLVKKHKWRLILLIFSCQILSSKDH